MSPFRSFAVIPAAGHSRRMGRPKLLLPYGDTTLIERVLAAWSASKVSTIVVVVRPGDMALADVCRRHRVEVVVPPIPPSDMKASIVAGLAHIAATHAPRPGDAWIVAPADLPDLTAATIDAVISQHDPSRPCILVAAHQGKRGHPVLFPWPLAREVSLLGEDAGLSELLTRRPVELVECGPAATARDLDTPDDYDGVQRRP